LRPASRTLDPGRANAGPEQSVVHSRPPSRGAGPAKVPPALD
jgi:hypothetical protein